MILSAIKVAPSAYVAAEAPRILPCASTPHGRFMVGGASDAVGDVALKSEAGGLRRLRLWLWRGGRRWRRRLLYGLQLKCAGGQRGERRREGGLPPCPGGALAGDARGDGVQRQVAGSPLGRSGAQTGDEVAGLGGVGGGCDRAVGVAERHTAGRQLVGAVGGEELGGAGGLQPVARYLQARGEELDHGEALAAEVDGLHHWGLGLLIVHVVAGGQAGKRREHLPLQGDDGVRPGADELERAQVALLRHDAAAVAELARHAEEAIFAGGEEQDVLRPLAEI